MMGGLLFYLVLMFVSVSGRRSPNHDLASGVMDENPELYPSAVRDDADMDVPDLITSHGYPIEVHYLETKDKYILEFHRIPHGKNQYAGGNRTVVFLMHGLVCSSADWIIMGPEKGLGYVLADHGYDVWMGNARGNFYSRRHRTLDPQDSKFWDFSWHEIGIYDVPEMVDYILAETKRTKIHYIGHSQGTTTFMVMATMRPEYNAKFESVQLLAPAIIMTHARSPFFRIIAPFSNTVGALASVIGMDEFLPRNELIAFIASHICKEESRLKFVCTNVLFIMGGFNEKQFNMTMLPVLLANSPAGASAKQFVHYGQGYKSRKFSQFNYGVVKNLFRYWWPIPPEYDLSLVTAPVAMHYSDDDWLVAPKDAAEVYSRLGNPIGYFKVPLKHFSHSDFLWAIDAKPLVYDLVIDIIKRNTNKL